MGETAPSIFLPCQPRLPNCYISRRQKFTGWVKKHEWNCKAKAVSNSWNSGIKKQKPSSFNYTSSDDFPLYEPLEAPFDQYLEDKPRVFEALFPYKQTSQQLNEDEWKIYQHPIQFFFTKVQPIVYVRLRCKSNGENLSPEVPNDITKLLQFDLTKWELQGIHSDHTSPYFKIEIRGAFYRERQENKSLLKNQLEMNINFVVPPTLALIPKNVFLTILESVFKPIWEDMKHDFNNRLLADYSDFKREKLQNSVLT
ncbi:DUF1997 family protein [Quillaja saponaria]|uniref:DUF1997 family protein n=1 Tax=Quillaja saponaria TaxID=32244 RepID=A0AAD7PXJ4_QUISA|nr:DUF1997 family protein [Quillaja saponaria]